MKKLVLILSSIILSALLLNSCSSMSESSSDGYFGYSNEPKMEQKETIQTEPVEYYSSSGNADYYDYNGTTAVSADPIPVKRSFVYYDYYNPSYTRTFIPWGNYYYDPYYDDFVGVRIYYGPRYNRYYWDDWDYYYYRGHYPYYHRHHYGYYDWVYYDRYYNRSWNNHTVYVEPRRKTTRNFGPSRGTYSGYDDVELRNPRSSSRSRSVGRTSSGDVESIYRTGSRSTRSERPTVRSTAQENSRRSVDMSPRPTREYHPESYTSPGSSSSDRNVRSSSSREEATRTTRSSRSSSDNKSYRSSSSRSSSSGNVRSSRSSSSSKSSGRSSRSSSGSSKSSRSERRSK